MASTPRKPRIKKQQEEELPTPQGAPEIEDNPDYQSPELVAGQVKQLTKEQRRILVQMFACYDTLGTIVEQCRQWGITSTATRRWAIAYDFSRRQIVQQKENVETRDLRDLFWKTRREYDAIEADYPVMKANYRSALLQRVADQHEANPGVILKVIEVAAKISDGGYRPQSSNVVVNANSSATAIGNVVVGITRGMIADALEMALIDLGAEGDEEAVEKEGVS